MRAGTFRRTDGQSQRAEIHETPDYGSIANSRYSATHVARNDARSERRAAGGGRGAAALTRSCASRCRACRLYRLRERQGDEEWRDEEMRGDPSGGTVHDAIVSDTAWRMSVPFPEQHRIAFDRCALASRRSIIRRSCSHAVSSSHGSMRACSLATGKDARLRCEPFHSVSSRRAAGGSIVRV